MSWSYLHNHWKCMFIGHSDSNESKDKGMTVTFQVTIHHNYWKNPNSCGPCFRFGTGHTYSKYYENMNDIIKTHVGAQLLVENNVWGGSCGNARASYRRESLSVYVGGFVWCNDKSAAQLLTTPFDTTRPKDGQRFDANKL
ncbi:pectin lyase-like protein [Serendipita vermifera]|nr:pectin lyase-like protein [Serendipita vermifera]